ncbi:MgtC/SapB family protein [Salinicola halimionae]|uniref:MgtC/SapB family protein n=1 Tax=Salinicola halimionae TaxID=1949081 RepID=UPI000DA24CB8|nr:MgtC/SapB family protein [Salinicola halimionae]
MPVSGVLITPSSIEEQLSRKSNDDKTTDKDDSSAEAFRANAKAEGWEVLGENDVLPPVSNLKPRREDTTTITFEYEGETYAVSQHISPFKYSVLENKLAGTEISQNDNNIEVKVEDSEATDVLNAKTTEDDKTVGELFHDKMKEAWGDLELEDPRRQYYELIQAKSALVNGYGILPYQTEKDAFPWDGDTEPTLPDSVIMDQASTYGLLKEEEISQKLAELSQNESVISGVDDLMQGSVNKIDDKSGLTNRVYETMMSSEYLEMLEGMNNDAAKTRFANDIKSLDYLDGSKANEVRGQVLDKGLIDEITSVIEEGSYTDEALETAVNDQVQKGLQGTFSSIFGITFSDRAVQNYLKNGEGNLPDDVKKGLDSYKAAVKIASHAIFDSFKENGSFDIKDVSSRISQVIGQNNPDLPTGVRNGAAALLQASMKNGVLPGMAGILTATAAIYTLNKNLGETKEDRMAAARLLLITVATSPAMALAATKTLETLFDKPGMATQLGLEDNEQLRQGYAELFPGSTDNVSVPEDDVIELESRDSQRQAISGAPPQLDEPDLAPGWADDVERFFDEIATDEGDGARFVPLPDDADVGLEDALEDPNERISNAGSQNGQSLADDLDELDADSRASVMGMVDDRISNMGLDPGEMDSPSKLRIVGTVLGTVGGVADGVGGVLDLALGAMSIDKLRDNPDALPSEYAAASMQLLGGVGIAGMAGTQLASMIAGPATASALGVASGALGIAGVGFGAIAAIVTGVIAKQKQDQKKEEVRDDFRTWGDLGVTEDDWGDKLNYVLHARYEYNYYHGSSGYEDLYPEDTPMWEARPDQYDDFTEYVADHGNISDGWFDDWDDDHDTGIGEGTPDPSGLPRFGDDGKPGTASDFKEDIDRVDVGSIELADDGRVIFVKDGVKQVIDPLIGDKAGENERKEIIEYLTDLHEITHPDGESDQKIIDRITRLHDESDRYNDITDLKRALDDSQPYLLGKDGEHKAGTFSDFEEDIDRVEIDSIELDPTDSSKITFIKDGVRWQLDTENRGSLSKSDANDIFDYLKNLYTIIHPDGELDQERADEISELQGASDDYNDLDDLRDELDLGTDPSGLPVFGDGGIPGTYGDFKEDIDRVDIGSIELKDDGRVIFVKDGTKQIINTSEGDSSDRKTREKIIRYLTDLHDIARPDGELDQRRVDEMNDVFGKTDRYNDTDAIKQYLNADAPAAWNENPGTVNIFGDSGSPGNFGDFKEDIDKVDVASIRIERGPDKDQIYFKKSGTWYVLTPNANSKVENEFDKYKNYLTELHDIIRPDGVLDKRLAAQIDELLGSSDDYNDLDDLKEFLNVA